MSSTLPFTRRAFCNFAVAAALGVSCKAASPSLRSHRGSWKVGTSYRLWEESSAGQFLDLRRAGMQAVELGVPRVDSPEAVARYAGLFRQAREWADAAELELWSLHVPFGKDLDLSSSSEPERQQVVRRLSACFDAYKPLGVKKMNIHGSSEITKPIPDEERRARHAAARRSVKELSEKAAGMNSQLALECLPRACLGNTSAEILALIDGIDSLGVTLDTNHLLQEKPEDFAKKVGSRIVNTHIADYDGIDERHWLPGKGIVDFNAVVSALEVAGYPGPFIFECAGTPEEKTAFWRKLQRVSEG
jgi:sugar phosphate isomerase/epimerase